MMSRSPKTHAKICALALSEMWVQLIAWAVFNEYANWSVKELKKRIKETGIARCTDLLNDQTLDKVACTDSETDFSSTESALWEWHARKEHNFPVSKKLAVTQRFAQQIFRSKSSYNTNYSKRRQK